MGKKKGNKQAWLDWLADEPPSASAQQELRDRFKRQANSYKPVNRAQPQPIAQPSVAVPQHPVQPQAASHATSAPKPVSEASSAAPPATVSIQIHLPSFPGKRLRKLFTKLNQGITTVKTWFMYQLAAHKARTLGITIGVPLLIVLLFLPPLFNFGYGRDKTEKGGSAGTSAGSTVKYEKPPFQVVTPSTKTKLATPDGVHAAYDGEKNVYTYSDSIGGNGFTVSQQPIPSQFPDGPAAVESIAPTLNKGVTPVKLKVITGVAYVSTNPKYDSQAIVANVRDVLIFIQSAHAFKTSEWENYLNTLQ